MRLGPGARVPLPRMAPRRWPVRFSAALCAPLGFALALLASQARAADEDLAAIQLRGTLRVLVLESATELPRNTPGFSSAELVQEFASRQGLKVQEIPVSRSDLLLPALLAGKGDLLAVGIAATAADAGKVAFTQPLWVVDEVLVGKRGAAGLPTRPSDLAGRKVSAVAGSAAQESLEALKASSVPGLLIEPLSRSDRRRADALRGEPRRPAAGGGHLHRARATGDVQPRPAAPLHRRRASAGVLGGADERPAPAGRAGQLPSGEGPGGALHPALHRGLGRHSQARRAARHHPQQRRQLLSRTRRAPRL